MNCSIKDSILSWGWLSGGQTKNQRCKRILYRSKNISIDRENLDKYFDSIVAGSRAGFSTFFRVSRILCFLSLLWTGSASTASQWWYSSGSHVRYAVLNKLFLARTSSSIFKLQIFPSQLLWTWKDFVKVFNCWLYLVSCCCSNLKNDDKMFRYIQQHN